MVNILSKLLLPISYGLGDNFLKIFKKRTVYLNCLVFVDQLRLHKKNSTKSVLKREGQQKVSGMGGAIERQVALLIPQLCTVGCLLLPRSINN